MTHLHLRFDQETILEMVAGLQEFNHARCDHCRALLNIKSFALTSTEHTAEEEAMAIEWVTGVILCSVCLHQNHYRLVAYPDDSFSIEFMGWPH